MEQERKSPRLEVKILDTWLSYTTDTLHQTSHFIHLGQRFFPAVIMKLANIDLHISIGLNTLCGSSHIILLITLKMHMLLLYLLQRWENSGRKIYSSARKLTSLDSNAGGLIPEPMSRGWIS